MGSRNPGAGSGGGSGSFGSSKRGRNGSLLGAEGLNSGFGSGFNSNFGKLFNPPDGRGAGSVSSRSRSGVRISGDGNGSRSRSNRSRGSVVDGLRVGLLGKRVSIVPANGALLHPTSEQQAITPIKNGTHLMGRGIPFGNLASKV